MQTRIFFVTDVHGSERCFRKFINAGKFYDANVLILGGDITGKTIIPIITQNNGTWVTKHTGTDTILNSKDELHAFSKNVRDSGSYPFIADPIEVEEMYADKESVTRRFNRLMVESINGWMRLAEERLQGTGIKCFISPGNDDIFEIDDALNSSSYVVNPEEKVVEVDEKHEMITIGTTNHTPWNSPREVDEEVLDARIEAIASKLKDPTRAIWNIHVPPIDTPIDKAPKLDSSLKPVIEGGQLVMIPAGSAATRRSIEKYQPLVGLHGHIHESKGLVKIGRTMCFNPGSVYSEGVLMGLLCELEDNKVKTYMFTTG
jgi:uncharacterized protein